MNITFGYRGISHTLEDIQDCIGPGWKDLIARLVQDLEQLGWDGSILQVKEKFGGLRFYISCGTDEIFDRIHAAEEESFTICERCAKPGKLRSGGWLLTLCDECVKK